MGPKEREDKDELPSYGDDSLLAVDLPVELIEEELGVELIGGS